MEIVALCLLAVGLGGCMRYEESITIDEHGAGTASIVLTRPETHAEPPAAEAALRAWFDARFSENAMKKGLSADVACEYAARSSEGRTRIAIKYRFASIHKFIAWAANSNSWAQCRRGKH